MSGIEGLKTRVENANALGRQNLTEKGVVISEYSTTYNIMSKIADVESGGGNAGLPIEIAIPQFAIPELDITSIDARCQLYNPPMVLISTGTQYIDTGYVPTANTKIVADFKFTELESNFYTLYGAVNSNNNGIKTVSADAVLYTRFGSISSDDSVRISTNTLYHLEQSINGMYLDGELRHQYSGTAFASDLSQTLYIFANNNNGSVEQHSLIKLHNFKIYENEELVRDFVPVTDESGVACLYDNITKAYFYNKGTGTFTLEVA